jgi:hypothetical protein
MKRLRLKTAFTWKKGPVRGHLLYVVGKAKTAFYVGKASDPLRRLREHVGLRGRGQGDESALGELILYNLPLSLSWQVQLLTLADCSSYVAQAFPTTNGLDWYSPENQQAAMGDAEIALIRRLHPCLNSMQNLTPTPLPAIIVDPYKFSSVPTHPRPQSYLRQLLAA